MREKTEVIQQKERKGKMDERRYKGRKKGKC
jgi:hypothetical protein